MLFYCNITFYIADGYYNYYHIATNTTKQIWNTT